MKVLAKPSFTILAKSNQQFWEKVSVFPQDVKSRKDAYRQQTFTALGDCGRGNLLFLCQRLGLSFKPDSSATALATKLLQEDEYRTLWYLADFARAKDKAINEEYDLTFPEGERSSHHSDVDALTQESGEKLKLLTKLIVLYAKDKARVRSVFFRHWWRRLRTFGSFTADQPLKGDVVDVVENNKDSLLKAVKSEVGSRSLRYWGHASLSDGQVVFVLHREYKPSAKLDYHDRYKTLFSYGSIVFGINPANGTLTIKKTSTRIAKAIQLWANQVFGMSFGADRQKVFSKYDPVLVAERFLGGYDEASGLKIVGMRLNRTTAPDHPPLTLESSFAGPSLKDALLHFYAKEILRLRTLSDIDWLRLRFASKDRGRQFECTVEVVPHSGGTFEFALDDTGLRESERDEFAAAFKQAFSLPIDRLIDPKSLGLGKVDIYRFLLDTDLKRDVQHYHQDCLKDLIGLGITSERPERVRVCKTGYCESRNLPVHDRNFEQCPRCHQPLAAGVVRKLFHDETKMIGLAGDILAEATGWTFSKRPVRFEKNDFYPLRNPNRPEEQVCVFFNKRITKSKIELFDRSMFPVLAIHTSGDYEHAYLDMAGMAHLGFAYAVASHLDNTAKLRFKDDCQKALTELLQKSHMRILRAAHQSLTTLQHKPEGYGGTPFEADIFNLLHGILSYIMKWGGKNSPDGFCSLLYYEENDLSKVTKFNWSYDTKFSDNEDGYDFGMSEKRQMFDYVSALFKQKRLQTQGNRLDAHVIISNNLDNEKMKDAAQVMRRKHRLGKLHPGLKLVLMTEKFVISLFQAVSSREPAFRKRWPYLSERLASMMQNENSDGYVYLDAADARSLVDWVLAKDEIDTPVEPKSLREDLKETMEKE